MNNDPRYQAPPGAPYPGQPPMQPQYPGQPPQYAQYPQQPTMQAQPPKKKRNKLVIGCATLIAVIVIISIIAAVSGGGKSSSTTTTPSSSDSSSAPSKLQAWQTTHSYTGNGAKKTETIAVGNDWKIQWSCTPGSFSGMDYNVIVGVYNSDATPADLAAINTMCKIGNASGETEEHTGGNVYLDITSEGSWSVSIQELK